jgi:hypothetical protein
MALAAGFAAETLPALRGAIPPSTGVRAPALAPAQDGSRAPDTEPGARSAAVGALRAELALREEVAAILAGAPALAGLAATFRAGGEIPDLPPLSTDDRARLLAAAAHARASAGSLGAAAERLGAELERLAAELPADGPLRLVDAAAELATLAGSWAEAPGIKGPAAARAPEEVAGGSSPGGAGTRGDVDFPPSEGAAAPIDLPGGLPIAPGSARGEIARPAAAGTAVDPAAAWLRRPELEPRWFPVIEAYLREAPR